MFENYQPLSGSERRPGSTATYLRPVGPNETYSVTIVLRRRPDGPPVPSQEYFSTIPPNQRRRLSTDEFAALYGASPDDVAKVADFVRSHGMQVTETNAARRTVIVSGTAAQMSAAFRVNLGYYSHRVIRRHGEKPQTEDYRGRDGVIQVPTELSQVIIGVFGLDNRRITKHNAADPPNTNPVSVATLRQLYDFPTNSAAGQTIGILSEAGYLLSDINLSFGGNPPQVTDVSVDASNNGTADGETTQDICIAGLAAPGAQIAVFFTTFSQQGWVDLISRVAHPNPGDPVCSVMSSSFYVSNGDDATTLANEGISQSWITAVTAALQDAAIQNVTVCIASGDTGTNSKVGDGKAHVQYPASDPWVLSVGGTTVGNISGTSFDEYVWNDPAPSDPSHWGTTGGGVSDQFPLPQYQADANVPPSLNDGQVRRGVPDVAANASLNSGYSGLYVGGSPFIGNGTSGSSPLWAGLIAVINAAIGHSVGFVNPALYTIGSSAFRSIYGPPGPTDNSNGGVAGYPATQPGWNACTGWGSPKGNALCQSLMSYHFHGSNFSKAQRFALNQAPNRAAASACTVASGCDLGSLPEEIRSRLNNASVKQFAGVVDSIVAQPPYLAVGIYNQQQSKIQGFVIPDTTVEAQQCAIKAIFTAYEAKSSVNVYYQDPGGVLYAIVISAT